MRSRQVQQITRVPLPRSFYDRAPVEVACELLGMHFWRRSREGLTGGTIVEVEAYLGDSDPASHSFIGQTRRNASMFGPPGHLYVYSIHARFCLNVVTGPARSPTAVLIRAIQPLQGIALMQRRRNREDLRELTRGPARLCQSVRVEGDMDGLDLTIGRRIWITRDPLSTVSPSDIVASPRIGVSRAQDAELRFFVNGSPFVSGPRRRFSTRVRKMSG